MFKGDDPPQPPKWRLPNRHRFRWDQLLRAGFPYVKASVLKEVGKGELVRTLVPAEFQQPES